MLLSLRSPVFHRMFAVDMQEANSKRVSIEDFDADVVADVVEQLIRYIHTGSINESLEVSARELLKIADKYDVAGLKLLAQKQMSNGINDETVGDTLEVAVMIADAEALRKKCCQYIEKNTKALKSKGSILQLNDSAKVEFFNFIFKH